MIYRTIPVTHLVLVPAGHNSHRLLLRTKLPSHGYPAYPVLDSVTPLGDQAVLSTYLLASTTNQPIIASTAMLLLMRYDSTIIPTHRAPTYKLLLVYISILYLRLL